MDVVVRACIYAIKFADLEMVQQSGNCSAISVLWVAHMFTCGRAQNNATKRKENENADEGKRILGARVGERGSAGLRVKCEREVRVRVQSDMFSTWRRLPHKLRFASSNTKLQEISAVQFSLRLQFSSISSGDLVGLVFKV